MAEDRIKFPTTAEGWSELAEHYAGRARSALAENIRREVEQLDPMDCALSYWADGLTARLNETLADICRNQGHDTFRGLYQLQGGSWVRVRAKMVNTRFGMRWLALAEDGRTPLKWLPVTYPGGPVPKVYRTLHLEVRDERAPAWARLDSVGWGLSGRVWVRTWRLDGGFPDGASTFIPDQDPGGRGSSQSDGD